MSLPDNHPQKSLPAQRKERWGLMPDLHSLKVKAGIASIFGILIVMAIIGSIITLAVERELRDTLGTQIEKITAVNAKEIDENIRILQEMLTELSHRLPPTLQGNDSAVEAFIRSDGALFSLVDAVVIYRADGSVAADWPVDTERRKTNYAFRDWFQKTLRTRQPVISRPFGGKNTKTPRIVATAPVLDASGQVTALVTGTILAHRKTFLGQHLDSGIGRTGFFVLTDPEGVIIFHPDSNRIMTGVDVAGEHAMKRLKESKTGHFEVTNREGKKRLVAVSSIERADWMLIGAMPVEEAFAPLAAIRNRTLILSAILTLVLGPLVWLFFDRLLRPLFHLRQSVEAMQNGLSGKFTIDDEARGSTETRVVAEALEALLNDVGTRNRDLKESEARYRRIIDTAQEGIWVIDQNSKTSFVNPRMTKMLGYETDEMLGKMLFDFMDDDAITVAKLYLERRHQGISEQHDFRLRHKNGTAVWTMMSTNPIIDETGKYQGALAMVSDISARKHAEETILKLNAELEQRVQERTVALATTNKELETFTYTVSHDLKAPLRGIDGYSQLLLQNYADRLDEEGVTFLQNVRKAAQKMGNLISDLLEYSRFERIEPKLMSVNLRAVIDSLLEEYADEIKTRDVKVTINLNCGDTVHADHHGLATALRNLIGNALKFSQNTAKPEIEIGCSENAAAHQLWVRDNGEGFDMNYSEKIFLIFQRLNHSEKYAGTGVGLAIVRKAMDRIGGRAWARSEPGKGATFHLEFPKQAGQHREN